VQDAGALVAAAHMIDRHMIYIDHAGQICAWARLEDHAQTDQSMSVHRAARRTGPRGQLLRSHFHEAGERFRASFDSGLSPRSTAS